MNSGPGTGPAGRRLLAALDRLMSGTTAAVTAEPNRRGHFQLEGRGSAFQWATIAHLEDAGLISIEEASVSEGTYWIRFTAAGRELLGA